MRKKLHTMIVLLLTFAAASCLSDASASSYGNYTYSSDNFNGQLTDKQNQANPVAAPAAFTAERIVTGAALGIGDFKSPQDVCTDSSGNIYLLDSGLDSTGNGRIVVLDSSLSGVRCILTSADGLAGFQGATGIFVDDAGHIYVAQPDSGRIVCLESIAALSQGKTAQAKVVRTIASVDTSKIVDSFRFAPSKLAVDHTGRLYVVSRGNLYGLLALNADGSFSGFTGANKVSLTFWEILWRRLSTQAQREGQTDYVPVEFSNVDIDSDGFVYTTARGDTQNQMVRKLNINGTDILPRTGLAISGELSPYKEQGFDSLFTDVSIGPDALVSCLDSVSGKIFSYDSDGNMVFEFGGLSDRKDTFKNPVAVQWIGDRIAVLDTDTGRLCLWKPTEYGQDILDAVHSQYEGDFQQAWDAWAKVLRLDGNNETAYTGVGQALYRKGEYRQAAAYFRLGSNKAMYSKAFEAYRKQAAAQFVPVVGIALGALLAAWLLWKVVRYTRELRRRYRQFRELLARKKKADGKGIRHC